jgi:hypothetical protein
LASKTFCLSYKSSLLALFSRSMSYLLALFSRSMALCFSSMSSLLALASWCVIMTLAATPGNDSYQSKRVILSCPRSERSQQTFRQVIWI